MTDTAKPTWTRHPACRLRIFNEPVDIEAHRLNCPADLRRDLTNAIRDLGKIAARLDALEERPTELPPPVVNDDVADWDDEYVQVSQYADGEAAEGTDGEPSENTTDTPYFAAIDRDDTYTR